MRIRIRDLFDPGSGIRNGKNSDPGSGINIPCLALPRDESIPPGRRVEDTSRHHRGRPWPDPQHSKNCWELDQLNVPRRSSHFYIYWEARTDSYVTKNCLEMVGIWNLLLINPLKSDHESKRFDPSGSDSGLGVLIHICGHGTVLWI